MSLKRPIFWGNEDELKSLSADKVLVNVKAGIIWCPRIIFRYKPLKVAPLRDLFEEFGGQGGGVGLQLYASVLCVCFSS